jgi:ribose 5-phosphate isomerase A
MMPYLTHEQKYRSMSEQNKQKKMAAEAALQYINQGDIVGVGTGSTVDFFIDALANIKHKIDGAVSSSEASTKRLKKLGIDVFALNDIGELPIYVDGADEFNEHRYLIKGGGGALTREKIVRAAAQRFVCITDQSKRVDVLGKFPLAIEVIPMARSAVARKMVKLGANPVYRHGFVTDNGNVILDCFDLDLTNPVDMEQRINNIPGVITNGLFALQGADIVLMASANGVTTFE